MATKLLAEQKLKHPQDLTIRPIYPFHNRSKTLKSHLAKLREQLLSHFTGPFPFKDNTSFGQMARRYDSLDNLELYWVYP